MIACTTFLGWLTPDLFDTAEGAKVVRRGGVACDNRRRRHFLCKCTYECRGY